MCSNTSPYPTPLVKTSTSFLHTLLIFWYIGFFLIAITVIINNYGHLKTIFYTMWPVTTLKEKFAYNL